MEDKTSNDPKITFYDCNSFSKFLIEGDFFPSVLKAMWKWDKIIIWYI